MIFSQSLLLRLTLLCLSPMVFADSTTLLNQAGSEIDLSNKIFAQKELKLDNPFVIQAFSTWKSMGAMNKPEDLVVNSWVELVLNKDHGKALAALNQINPKAQDTKLKSLKDATELYLLYQVGAYQSFLGRFIELSTSTNFLETELGIGLDQHVGKRATAIILESGFIVSDDHKTLLKKIENIPSKINVSLQAFNALRTRENAVSWIGKLEEGNPLKIPLAQTALLHYAKEGKLGASGKIIKGIIEPILINSNDTEEISLYFLTLGRLLYQAGALDESRKYFSLIPESSQYFLNARTESLWAHLRARDYSKTKGELATLELKMFSDKFYPEAYLVSSMASVMLCQFSDSKASVQRFIDVNKFWAREIDKNLKAEKPNLIKDTFFTTHLKKSIEMATKEKSLLQEINAPFYQERLDNTLAKASEHYTVEAKQQWKNRESLLEKALYKMKFVKIELISRMRQAEMDMQIAGVDEVRVQNAAPARKNQMKFPRKGDLWGDELFQINASIVNKCVNGHLNKDTKGDKK
jgi:hypothetical protein